LAGVLYFTFRAYFFYKLKTAKQGQVEPPQVGPPSVRAGSDSHGWRALGILLRGWLTSPSCKWQARGLIFIVIIHWLVREAAYAFILTKVDAEVLNSITELSHSKDINRVRHAFLSMLAWNIGLSIPLFSVIDPWVSTFFKISFRNYATTQLIDSYLDPSGQAFYHIKMKENTNTIDNPDQRIVDDINQIADSVYNVFGNVLSAFFGFSMWSAVIFYQGGSVLLSLAAGTALVHILISYGYFGSWLVDTQKKVQATGATLRYGLMRVRENAEGVALSGGVTREKTRVNGQYDDVINAGILSTWVNMLFGTCMGFINLFPGIILWICQLPRIMDGSIGVGDALRIQQGYGQCMKVVDFFSGSFGTFMVLQADSERVDQLWIASRSENTVAKAMEPQHSDSADIADIGAAVDESGREQQPIAPIALITNGFAESPLAFALENLMVGAPGSDVQVGGASVSCERGSALLVSGASGLGKTSVLRALAGLWREGSGTVRRAESSEVVFLPQACYIPHGTLQDVITYPEVTPIDGIEDDKLTEEVAAALRRARLDVLLEKWPLDGDCREWGVVLSAGEKQRVGFARLFLRIALQGRVDDEEKGKSWAETIIAIMDESTSGVEVSVEAALYAELREELQNGRLLAMVSVGHRPTLPRFHDAELQIDVPADSDEANATSTTKKAKAKAKNKSKKPQNDEVLSSGLWQTLSGQMVPWRHVRLSHD